MLLEGRVAVYDSDEKEYVGVYFTGVLRQDGFDLSQDAVEIKDFYKIVWRKKLEGFIRIPEMVPKKVIIVWKCAFRI